ncbi:MAG: hypothetical protein ACD_80C00194G0004 [uncultured bacterium (gcode 4)]|uniref:Adenylosuccinate synthetase n=1 Tax=uncultured bacterium (gcode 4) TaxID=1234023 RepID=K1X3G1_9BACT|nr:MAG: hypothetical protein ACD_80C00194G0004 [uncultured bacterium (gcode 4)]HBB04063.1 adenylosuccinate synthase [Candidatus Gracilibacteria bacterium]
MKIDVLLGLQWGDEGKGKIIDVLTPQYDIIARFQGGPNAGHTIEFEGQKHVLHLIPSGIFHPGKINFMGNGMVICPIALIEEIKTLTLSKEITEDEIKKRIVIAERAKLILPTHRLLDAAKEAAKGDQKIGSTLKGIGPAYEDHIGRDGVCVGDIKTVGFIDKFKALREKHFRLLESLGYKLDWEKLIEDENKFMASILAMKSMQIVNGPYWIDKQLKAGKKILAEGAQGSLLDIDFGNYPFVTSSSTIAGGVCIGLGIAPNRIGKVYGLFKAYCTRVGSGPFPTEMGGKESEAWCANTKRETEVAMYSNANINDPDSEFMQGIALRTKGYEYGATTGRLRRCGWLDMVALKYACMINGVTDLVMSKADVLSGFETVRICNNYLIDGKFTDEMPMKIPESLEPQYTDFKGWNWLTTPPEETPFMEYLNYIEEETGIPISIISTGPDRTEIIHKIILA